jgi:hypothetical protein
MRATAIRVITLQRNIRGKTNESLQEDRGSDRVIRHDTKTSSTKKEDSPWKAVMLALLPAVFNVVNILAQPAGGWEQHKQKSDDFKHHQASQLTDHQQEGNGKKKQKTKE